MKLSTWATAAIVFLAIGILCTLFVWSHHGHADESQPGAIVNVEGDYIVRLWVRPNFFSRVRPEDMPDGSVKTITSNPVVGRSLFVEVRKNGELVQPLREMDVDFSGPADSITVSYSKDRNYAVISSVTNLDLLVLTDLSTGEFASPMTIWSADYEAIRLSPTPRMRSDFSPGPVRKRWMSILDSIRSANPELELDWGCLK